MVGGLQSDFEEFGDVPEEKTTLENLMFMISSS